MLNFVIYIKPVKMLLLLHTSPAMKNYHINVHSGEMVHRLFLNLAFFVFFPFDRSLSQHDSWCPILGVFAIMTKSTCKKMEQKI